MNLNKRFQRVLLVALVGLALTAAACTPQPGGATTTTVPTVTPWTFTLHVGVTGDMVTRYGGMAALRSKVDSQLAVVNQRYATPFERPIVWKVYDFFQYDVAPSAQAYLGNGGADFTLLYTENIPANESGGYASWVRTAIISWPQAGYGGVFSSYGTDSVVHELGHARSALDVYCETIKGVNNPVNGQSFTAPSGVMSTLYGVTNFDAYSTAVINAAGSQVFNDMHIADQSLPSTFKVKVVNSIGTPVSNASVNIYAGACTGSAQSIQSTPQSTGTTTSGAWTMPVNPFTAGSPNIQTKILLVTASAGGKSGFAWLPLHEAGLAFFAGQSTFTTSVTLG